MIHCKDATLSRYYLLHYINNHRTYIYHIYHLYKVATITNIGANYKLRTENSNFPNRTLKIGFTDGTLMAYGFE